MTDWHTLDEHNRVIPCTLDEAVRMRKERGAENDPYRVDLTYVTAAVRVSTVFLAIDHQHGDGPPLYFETMVFGGALDQEMDRYSTWEAAEAGHAAMVARVRAADGDNEGTGRG